MHEHLTAFWNWVDQRLVVRRIVLGIAIHLIYVVTYWAIEFANTTTRTGADFALFVTAVTGPATAFAAFAFKIYSDSRDK